jgi:hypothetical protein
MTGLCLRRMLLRSVTAIVELFLDIHCCIKLRSAVRYLTDSTQLPLSTILALATKSSLYINL